MNCQSCGKPLDEGRPYCGWCGRRASRRLSSVRDYVDRRVDEALNERVKDREVVTLQLTQQVVERITAWAKLLFGAVSIILALMAVALGFLGIQGWAGFRAFIAKAEKTAAEGLSKAEQAEEEAARERFARVSSNAESQMKAELARRLRDSAVDLVPDLSKNVAAIQQQVSAIQAGERPPNLLPTLRTEQKILGIDISHRTGKPNWQALRSGGITFVFIKATQGSSFVDPQFGEYMRGCLQAGLVCGAYHYFSAADPNAQAIAFAKVVEQFPHALIAVDVEPGFGSTSGASLAQFLAAIQEKLRCVPIIYTTSTGWSQLQFSGNFVSYPLWVAYFGSGSSPSVPSPWKRWTFWQFTDTGTVQGLAGTQNITVFNGNRDALAALAKVHS